MNNYGPVQLELFVRGARICGHSREADQSRRLSDVINSASEVLVLNDVTVGDQNGSVLEQTEMAVIEKRHVLFLVPRETAEQMAFIRMQRLGISSPGRIRVPSLVVVPPYVARGVINVAAARDVLQGVGLLPRFFPLMDATITLNGVFQEQIPAVLINRDAVAVLSSIESQSLGSQLKAS